MRPRHIRRFRPGLERLEDKQPPSAGLATIHVANLETGSRAWAVRQPERSDALGASGLATSRHAGLNPRRDARPIASHDLLAGDVQAGRASSSAGFTIFRITNTAYPLTVHLKPPFQQVLVQSRPPAPGQVYNVLSLAMRNGTDRTFDVGDGFAVRLRSTGVDPRRWYPILTGNEQWRPGRFLVVYVLSKQYYPIHPTVSGGFTFNFAPGRVAIPGPSGIFLRLTYRPATFAKTLDWIVAHGPGAQGGAGAKLGLPDTAIWELVFANSVLKPR